MLKSSQPRQFQDHLLVISPDFIGCGLGLADSTELTAREINVLRLVCDGLEYGEIAEQLNISERTVKYHVSNILSKTGYANKTRLAIDKKKKKFIIPRIPEDSSDLQ